MIDEIIRVLEGDTEELRGGVEERMRAAAERLDFERAAELRDVLGGLDALSLGQRVHRTQGGDFDILGLARDGDLGAGVILRVRRGLLLGRESLRFANIATAVCSTSPSRTPARCWRIASPRSRSPRTGPRKLCSACRTSST
jgi:excinuclease UvrABC nuclease subunit